MARFLTCTWLAVLTLCGCTEHGSGGAMVCGGLVFIPDPRPPASVAVCVNEGLSIDSTCIAPIGSGVCIDGRRTTLCASDADCLAGFRCATALGANVCEKECDADVDCVRCHLFCDTSVHICRALSIPFNG